MKGICYWTVLNGVESFENTAQRKILPFPTARKTFDLGMAEIGFSVHITSNELQRDLVLGSPGAYDWKGSVMLETTSLNGNRRTIIPSIKKERRIYYTDYFGKYHVCNFRNFGIHTVYQTSYTYI